MRKNGFTLIELLAVIVILAIIALIATPIILGIINDAREESNERGVELYASAVRNGIAAYQLRTGNEVLTGTYNEYNPLPFEVEYDGKVDCTSIIISEDGKVSLDKCTVNGGKKEYSYGIKEVAKKMCTFANVGVEGKIGSKYICNLGETSESQGLVFYVLEEENANGDIVFIYEKNHGSEMPAWCESSSSNSCNADGLNSKLYDIQKEWSKLNQQQIGIPTYDQLYKAAGNNTQLPSWLVNLGDGSSLPHGYWTATPYIDVSQQMAWMVAYYGDITTFLGVVDADGYVGVRPVITIPVNEIE